MRVYSAPLFNVFTRKYRLFYCTFIWLGNLRSLRRQVYCAFYQIHVTNVAKYGKRLKGDCKMIGWRFYYCSRKFWIQYKLLPTVIWTLRRQKQFYARDFTCVDFRIVITDQEVIWDCDTIKDGLVPPITIIKYTKFKEKVGILL